MKKQTSLIVRNTLIAVILSVLTVSVSAKQNQQTVLLDANGKPLSLEVLQLLSSASGKISPSSKEKKSRGSKGEKELAINALTTPKNAKKVKYHNNPLLEEELLQAMKEGNSVRVKQLIKINVRPTYKNYKGETPLGVAVSKGWASIAVDLLKLGADVNQKGTQGLTLLHVAAAKNYIDMAKLLVKHGIKPSTKTKTGWTPLHVASRYGHWQLVQYFLKLGVDPNTKNKAGRTALDLAITLKHQGIIKILSRVTSEKTLNQIRVEKLRVVRMENHRKRLEKLEELKEFRRLKLGMKKKKK